MSTSGSASASEAAKNFFSKTHVIYIFNFIQNLVLAAVVTAVYTSIMGTTGQAGQVSLPIDINSMKNFSQGEVYNAFDYALSFPRGKPNLVMDPDAVSTGYSIDTLREFLKLSGSIDISYRAESFDCDDFAHVLLGREREWYGRMSPSNGGSTFGWISGDLRLHNETDWNYHAMNVFIDNYSKVWLIEPQTMEIFNPNQMSNQSVIDFIFMWILKFDKVICLFHSTHIQCVLYLPIITTHSHTCF